MRAVRFFEYGGPEVLLAGECPAPEPGEGQVLIKVAAAGVNPVDAKVRSGGLKAFFPLQLPAIAGRDGSGVVAAVGPKVTRFAVGEHACFIASNLSGGSYAEYVAVDESNVARAPVALSIAERAAIPLVALSAWIAVKDTADVKPGMKVLIHGGAGGIGGTAVQLARYLGAHVTTTCSSASTPYALENGAHRVIAYDREDFSEQLRDLDVVVDTIGGEVHDRSYGTLRRGGCLVYLLAQPIKNRGAEFDVAVRQALVFREVGQLSAACQLFQEGALVARVRKVLPLEAAAAAHSEIETGHGHGKLVLQLAV